MKIVKTLLFMVLFASVLCIAALAADIPGSGISELTVVDADKTTIIMQEADKDVVNPTNGVYIGAERFTVSCSGLTADSEYVIFVLNGTSTTPSEGNILYIDQAKSDENGNISFEVYPTNVSSGGMIYISSSSGFVKLASYKYYVPYTLGDVNSDKTINIIDVNYILNYIVGKRALDSNGLLAANVFKTSETDLAINILDAQKILNYIVGKISNL
jgi:hypothetical protein